MNCSLLNWWATRTKLTNLHENLVRSQFDRLQLSRSQLSCIPQNCCHSAAFVEPQWNQCSNVAIAEQFRHFVSQHVCHSWRHYNDVITCAPEVADIGWNTICSWIFSDMHCNATFIGCRCVSELNLNSPCSCFAVYMVRHHRTWRTSCVVHLADIDARRRLHSASTSALVTPSSRRSTKMVTGRWAYDNATSLPQLYRCCIAILVSQLCRSCIDVLQNA